MTVIETPLTIINELGLHARAAAKFVTVAGGFASDIKLARGERRVDGKSIMGVMLLAAPKGTELTLTAAGEDADEAVEALLALVADYFGEGK